jgi:hypothetical protein
VLNAYSILQNNDLSANGLFIFSTEDELAIEVMEKVEAGELTTANYRTFIDNVNQRGCRRAKRDKDDDIRQWDQIIEKGFCQNEITVLAMDNKVVYQKFIFFFSLQSRINSLKGCQYSNWILVPSYNAQLFLDGTVKFRKRCGTEVDIAHKDVTTGTTLSWRPYSGSRSLSHYDFFVTFSIDHVYNNPPNYHTSRQYRIKDGY